MATNENQRTLPRAVVTTASIITLMIAVFTLLEIFLPTSLVQPIGALVLGLILTIILVWMGKSGWGTAILTWLGMSVVLVIVFLIVSRSAIVVGTVVDRSNSPVVGLVLMLRDSGGVPHEVATDENGKFEVRNVPEGKYTISAGGQLLFSGEIPSGWKRIFDSQETIGTLVQEPSPTVIALVTPPPATLSPTTPPPTLLLTTPPPTMPPPTAEPSTATVTLTSLQDGQTVPCSNIARGTYPLDLEDYIWPFVYVGGRYHPQDEGGKAAQKIGGNWYQTVRFGDCKQPQKDVGQPFQLIIVTANESANAEIEKYIKSGQASGNWPGLIELPPGTKEYVRIAVIRQ